MIVVVEGPSAAGKTTWCREHAPGFLPEPGRAPLPEVLDYQMDRWRRAVAADERGELVVLDGDPFKLYFSWALRQLGIHTEAEWESIVEATRQRFVAGDYGLADLVLYSDPGEPELRRRKESDQTRSRRSFERNTAVRPYSRAWYEAVARLNPDRVVWSHPAEGLNESHLGLGRRPTRS